MTKHEAEATARQMEAAGLRVTGFRRYDRGSWAVDATDPQTGIPITIDTVEQWAERSNGAVKVAEMGYVTNGSTSKKDLKQQFKFGCMRVNDNLLTGHSGYVRDADGNIYKVCRESKQAELVNY